MRQRGLTDSGLKGRRKPVVPMAEAKCRGRCDDDSEQSRRLLPITRAMSTMPRPHLLAAFLIIAVAFPARATSGEPHARIVEIHLSGNEKTRDEVILRELNLRPGDVADPTSIELGRQAVMDLGLFRKVEATTRPVPGGVALEIEVREKYFLLVVPRVDTSSERNVSYGAQLRWANVWGLNHRLNLTAETGTFPEERDRREEDSLRLSYRAPYLFGTPYELRARLERLERVTPVIDPLTNQITDDSFDENFDQVDIGLARDLRLGRPRTGWILGAGLFWQRQDTSGDFAPPPDGQALALVGTAEFDDIRFHLYSETGRNFIARVEAAASGAASDYGYTRSTAHYFQSRALGQTPHQTWEMTGDAGLVTGGPGSRNEFSLGGSGRLRGYETDFLEGNRYYYGTIRYLRPVKWNWLRLMVFAESGGADDDREGLHDGSPYADVGLGVRVRLTWFVNVEIELGWAYPLRGGEGLNFFASGR